MIRDARADDFSSIASITNHYIQTTAIHFAYDLVSADDIRSVWDRSRERYPWLVSVTGGGGGGGGDEHDEHEHDVAFFQKHFPGGGP